MSEAKSKHTPEPWQARDNFISSPQGHIARCDPVDSSTCCNGQPFEKCIINSQHIVACVNACKGINPEAVPEMYAACRAMYKILENKHEWTQYEFKAALLAGKCAIAKAKEAE